MNELIEKSGRNLKNRGGGGWGCPHEADTICQRVAGKTCDPGMKGCVLFGRFVFSNPAKNLSSGMRQQKKITNGAPKPI